MAFNKPLPPEVIQVTKPLLPDEDELFSLWKEVMTLGWITNVGKQHSQLEEELKAYLNIENLTLFNNGTIALIVALKALNLPDDSEVITTPFTFAATPHAIAWNGLKPIFADINPKTMTLDPAAIEAAITPKTSAIVPVHVYGFPCDVEAIDFIAKKHNLKVIYDAAHAFTTEINGRSICDWGDVTMLSFHATKLFNSIEGGALVFKDANVGKKIFELRNFGIKKFEDFELVKEGIRTSDLIDEVGINGKLNEFQAAWARVLLKKVSNEQTKRGKVAEIYKKHLGNLLGISIPEMPNNVTNSMQYFPILFDERVGAVNRDAVYEVLKQNKIYARKYFYPLCSEFGCYKNYPSSSKVNLPISHSLANRVLCLPFYGELHETGYAEKICSIVLSLFAEREIAVNV